MVMSTLGLRPLFAPAVPCLAPLHAIWVVFLLTFNDLRGALLVSLWLQFPAVGLRM